jgi:hypothetical protein
LRGEASPLRKTKVQHATKVLFPPGKKKHFWQKSHYFRDSSKKEMFYSRNASKRLKPKQKESLNWRSKFRENNKKWL